MKHTGHRDEPAPAALKDEAASDGGGGESRHAARSEEARRKELIAAGRPWVWALQHLMRLPEENRAGPDFTWGRLGGDFAALEERARRSGRDIIHLEFGEAAAAGPTSIVLAIVGKHGVTIRENCELWVLNTWTKVEVMTPDRRFKLDDTGRLKGKPNNLDEMRARRVELTHKRWRSLAAEMAGDAAESDTPPDG